MKKQQNIDSDFLPINTVILNPKSVTVDELYGTYNKATQTWIPGILAHLMSLLNRTNDNINDELSTDDTIKYPHGLKWLILDGPVDTLWIESMNTVLDDNKVLTLNNNGDRIFLSNQFSLLFEVENLDQASPATVSRCGMIYFDELLIGYQSYIKSWLQAKKLKLNNNINNNHIFANKSNKNDNLILWTDEVIDHIPKLVNKYIIPIIQFKKDYLAEENEDMIKITTFHSIVNLCRLFDTLFTIKNGIDTNDQHILTLVEMLFSFSIVWSFGVEFNNDGRNRFDIFLRDIESQFPPLQTCYEYYVDINKKTWVLWASKVSKTWSPIKGLDFHKLYVPTVDTVRYTFLLSLYIQNKHMPLITGNPGIGKTALIKNYLTTNIDSNNTVIKTINFSAASTAASTQEIIESKLEKRQNKNYGPIGGKKSLIIFIDDLNMPSQDLFGTQSAIELLKQWVDYKYWYDIKTLSKKNILDLQLIAAMGPPGGARSHISSRFITCFNIIHLTFPADAQLERIYTNLIKEHFSLFEESIKNLLESITLATIDIYKQIALQEFLPTPSKSHYLFSMRDISKVFQGLLKSNSRSIDTSETMIRFYCHEMLKIFHDRLCDHKDQQRFIEILDYKLSSLFDTSWKELFNNNKPLFSDILNDDNLSSTFNDNTSNDDTTLIINNQELTFKLKQVKKMMLETISSYNKEYKISLVLFDEVIYHVLAIYRILQEERGNALLIGLGGSGRRTLAKLAAYIAQYQLITIQVSSTYTHIDFREDIKSIYKLCALENKSVVFLLSDDQIIFSSMMEDINNILNSGEITKLFDDDELSPILDELREQRLLENKDAINLNTDELYQYFILKVRKNLHIILTMSHTSAIFRNYVRMFPAIVSNTTIQWFPSWSKQALHTTAYKLLLTNDDDHLKDDHQQNDDNQNKTLAEIFTLCHTYTQQIAKDVLKELNTHIYITPAKYLELVKTYNYLLNQKHQEVTEKKLKLTNGLKKFKEAKTLVNEMTIHLQSKQKIVEQKKSQCDKLVIEIIQKQRAADEQKKC